MIKRENLEMYEEIRNNINSTGPALGTMGNILISYDTTTKGWNHGHAARVRENRAFIVEAMPSSGVRVYQNDWKTRFNSKKALYVRGAQGNEYRFGRSSKLLILIPPSLRKL